MQKLSSNQQKVRKNRKGKIMDRLELLTTTKNLVGGTSMAELIESANMLEEYLKGGDVKISIKPEEPVEVKKILLEEKEDIKEELSEDEYKLLLEKYMDLNTSPYAELDEETLKGVGIEDLRESCKNFSTFLYFCKNYNTGTVEEYINFNAEYKKYFRVLDAEYQATEDLLESIIDNDKTVVSSYAGSNMDFIFACFAVWKILYAKIETITFYSPKYVNSMEMYKTVSKIFDGLPAELKKDIAIYRDVDSIRFSHYEYTESPYSRKIAYTNVINFVGTINGITTQKNDTLFILDASYIPFKYEEDLNKALKFHANKKVIIQGTPNCSKGYFWEQVIKAKEKDNFSYIEVPLVTEFDDNPEMIKNFWYNDLYNLVGDEKFRTDYLLNFKNCD